MKRRFGILFLVIILLVLLTPVPNIYKDGGTKTYTSFIYKMIVWNTLDGKRGTELHLFPNNFHGLDYYND